MLAPAIPGTTVFNYYHSRTINSRDTVSGLTNYHFVIGFNENDQVTIKFKVAAKKIGSTSLACIQNEFDETLKIFNGDRSIMDEVDFSKFPNGKKQTQHSWLVYMGHAPQINTFLDKVIK
jgi:hypothetical protein